MASKKLTPPKEEKAPVGKVTLGKLKNLDDDGAAPESRLPTATSAHALYTRCEEDSYLDRNRIVSLRGIYDGLPPLCQKDLDDSGLGDMPNVNLKQFEGRMGAYTASWLDLNTNGTDFFEVCAQPKDIPPQYRQRVSNLLATFFNEAIADWAAPGTANAGHYIQRTEIRDTQMGLFGIGCACFLDPMDWRWEPIPLHRVLVARGTFIDMSNCQSGFVKWKAPLPVLYEQVRNDKKARSRGWNPTAVMWALYKHQSTSEGKGNSNWDFIKFMNEARNNDLDFIRAGAPEVKLVHVFCMEFGSDDEPLGISHKIMPAGGLTEYGYLYSATHRFETWQNVIIPFTDRVGPEGIWHGIKGFGDMIYDACHLNNQLFNWTGANAILNGLPIFTSTDGDTKNRLSRVKLTRMGILYPGIIPQQLKLNLDIEGTLGLFGESNNIMDQNTRMYGQQQVPETTSKGKPSPTEIVQAQMAQTQFSSIQIKNYRLTGLDTLGAEMYRRLTADGYDKSFPGGKQAAAFRKKCKDAGIPKEIYQDVKWVRATRNGGSGNSSVDYQKAKAVYEVATPGKGQMAARKDIVASLKGVEMVETYVEDEPQPTPDDKTIDLENQIMDGGQTPTAMPNEDAVKHLGDIQPNAPGHIGNLLKLYQQAKQIQDNLPQYMAKIGSDPLAVLRSFDAYMAHAGQHVKMIAAVPILAEGAKAYSQVLNELHGFGVQFAGNVQKALVAKQQQSGQGQDPKVQRELALTQAKLQVTQAEGRAKIQNQREAHVAKMRNLTEAHKVRQSLKIKDAQVSTGLKASATQAGIEMDKHRARKSVMSE
jgi:hypothetical protein